MIEYFYIITITWTTPGNVHIKSRHGIAEVADGEDQESTCGAIFIQACTHYGAPADSAAISYYYLARNEL